MKLSILICTRNGTATIGDAIACVGRQASVNHDDYEVIVVDNGSTDDTKIRAAEALKTLSCRSSLLQERREGKLSAFLAGVAASNGSLISVVDDDNLIGEEFIFRTLGMFESFPELGMVGSFNTLLAENPPAWFPWAAGKFACSRPTFSGDVRRIDDFRVIASFGLSAGAGSTFRKRPLQAALDRGFVFMNDAFRGPRLSIAAEDIELCLLLQTLGYWLGGDSRITLQHKINPSRLRWSYARSLCRSIGAGALVFDTFGVLSNHVRQSPYKNFRATWQWVAARHLRRLANLLPAVVVARLTGREIDPIWLKWDHEMGCFLRVCGERATFTSKMRAMWSNEWTGLRREELALSEQS